MKKSDLIPRENPLSAAQYGVYMEYRMQPDSLMYNLPRILSVPDDVKPEQLKEAIRKTVSVHPALHAVFSMEGDSPVMRYAPREPDIPDIDAASPEEAAAEFICPFDLEKGPLYRFAVCRCEDGNRLLADFHHIVCDGSSEEIILNDIAAACGGAELCEEPCTQFDVSARDAGMPGSEKYKRDKAWFDEKLKDMEPEEMIAPDASESADPGADRLSAGLAMDPEETVSFVRGLGITESALFMGAFAYTLSRFAGLDECCFTAAANGRTDGNLGRSAGMFVRMLPVRAASSPDEEVSAFLKKVRGLYSGACEHDGVSFAELAHDYGVNTDIVFNYRGEERLNRHFYREETVIGEADIPVKLNMELFRKADGYRLVLHWKKNAYSRALMESFACVFAGVAKDMLNCRTLREISLLPAEQAALIDGFNRTEVPYRDDCTVLDLFREAAEKYPEREAVVYGDVRLTYAELDEITDRIAAYINGLGIGREQVVSVLIGRSQYMAAASIGVLKAGAAYQPLDPSYPPERLAFMAEDADAKLLIADLELMSLLPDYHGPVLLTSDIPNLPEAGKPDVTVRPDDLFIMLYTSGSTGTPKGCQLTHGNLAAFCSWYHRYYELDETCKVIAYASYGFDACMMDMYSPLTRGAAVYIIPEDMRLQFDRLDEYIRNNSITHSFMTTQVGRMFAVNMKGSSLRCLSMGGEKLVPFEPEGSCRYFNGYGPTECTIFSTVYPVTRMEKDLPIGKALDNLKLYITDGCGRPLSVGMPGELCISGPQVSRGYRNRPEKNAEVFVSNPFCSEKPYDRMYRTGDIAAWMPDGNIRFVGRRDAQVKIRGFRIELTEVEEVIRRFEGIKDATVVAWDDPDGGKFIAAYVVSDTQVDAEALGRFIRSEKPPYMVPAVTVQMERIPLNQNQKVNKRALPRPELKQTEKSAVQTVPLNRLEKEIADLSEEVLHARVTDVTALLADFGLTSISSIRLATLIYKKYGISLAAGELVKGATIQNIENSILEKWMAPAEKDSTETEAQPPKTARVSSRLSFAQQGVYAECQADPDSTKYNLPFCLRMPEGITASQLKQAVLAVVAAHGSMRSRFAADENNEIRQMQVPDYIPDVPVLKLDKEGFEKEKTAFVRPFRLEEEVPARFEIAEAGDLYLLMDLHHLIADGASIDLFTEQLCGALDGKTPEREEYSYFDFAEEQKIDPEDEAFFDGRMALAEEASSLIPDVFEEGLTHKERSISVKTDLSAASRLAAKVGITPAAVYLAAVQITVSRYLYEDVSAIATISSGRGDLRMNNTIGMFVNTLPLTARIDGRESTEDFLRSVGEDFADTIRHEQYPFAKTAAKYDFHPAVSYAWQVGVLQKYMTKAGEIGLESISNGDAMIPAAVFIEDGNDGGMIRIAYDESMYTAGMMTGFAQAVDQVVKEMSMRGTVGEISLTAEPQWKVLDSYNRPFDLNFDASDTAVSLFRKQAAAHPDRTAAVYEDRKYSYRELDELTDRLSKVIYDRISRADGRGSLAEHVVSILCGRNENAFILPLAVLKAGCAYEPLDPGYPEERLNFMIRDAGACLLLSQDDLHGLAAEYTGDALLFSELYAADVPDVSPVPPSPEDLFIMLYTSGSTGTPKGVQIEHRNMIAYAHGACLEGFYTPECVTAAYASFGFDVNMADTFCTLLNGGTVHLIPENIRMDLDKLAGYFDVNGITAALLTTQVGVQFLQNYPKLKSLRFLTLGGEKLPAVHPEELSYQLNNGYGPTENCCGVSLFPVRFWEPNIPIGKPMRTIHGYVLDKTGHRLPAGAAGEYCLSGPQVSRGYLGRSDKTAEAYEDCPFNEFRMYHTGDVVRYRASGDVEFVGRKDGQVKIRGFRVETKEVEAVIREFPGVKDVTVQACDYESGGKYLAAWVVYDGTLNTEEFSAFIKGRKPAYMVPPAVMQIGSIPLTVNQKVDKKALPKPVLQQSAYAAPRGKTEEDLCRIFGGILGIEKVSAEDDFFGIGGSSITAMKVVIAAGKAGYGIVYQDVFNHPTPRDMASFIGGESTAADEHPAAEENVSANDAAVPEADPDGYDYGRIHELLRKNTLDAFRKGEKQPLGNVLLAGATGYLGIHVLKELLDTRGGVITCLIRPKKDASGAERLQSMLKFYFGSDMKELFGSRIRILEGDSTDPDALKGFDAQGITVINCAASVKHFARDNEIERTNVDSVRYLIEWCLRHDSRLVHISTESVMGEAAGHMPPDTFRFTEHVLYAGQKIDGNQYIHSKFIAERLIYEAIMEKGLNARVIRVGNLAPRFRDGQFQINYATNSFIRSLAAYRELGMIPYGAMDAAVEFSPIEYVARAAVLLSEAPRDCVCFMASNDHLFPFGDAVTALGSEEDPVRLVESTEFADEMQRALSDETRADKVSCLMTYDHGAQEGNIRELGPESLDTSLTRQILYRLGFRWPVTGSEYVKRFTDKLEGFFR